MSIVVVAYNPLWPNLFAKEEQQLQHALGERMLALHHIGSTAVPGLAAKPVIDMILVATSLTALDAASAQFNALGYEAKGENGIAGRRYYRKGGAHRTHHLHAFAAGDSHITRHLAFRDYLIAYPEVCRAYQTLKTQLAAAHCHDRAAYCQGKDSFIALHEQRALTWQNHQAEGHKP
ncbi:GrpB family protein [Pseudoalteromonas fenneropenaei]|uniref:GrpB family protein n=1 Tax=Pseudoalteromonas fenneropenaei TaxID=1737459 RepID=A0ABV7CJL6_9GAMM